MPQIEHWTIEKLIGKWDKLNLAPKYQRGSVWDERRKILLIDSILSGLDIPKIYLFPVRNNTFYDYEVIDGQQRIRAIKEFFDGKYAWVETNGTSVIGGVHKLINSLSAAVKKKFLRYKVTISVANVHPQQARLLFSRLQLGAALNQPELRNAMASNACHEIDSMVLNHAFFRDSKIPEARFKRHDYLTHALAYIASSGAGAMKDIKAQALKQFIQDKHAGIDPKCLQSAALVLDIMRVINAKSPGMFRNKWTFFDVFIFLHEEKVSLDKIDISKTANAIKTIEAQRRTYSRAPEVLLEGNPLDDSDAKLQYQYINAYKTAGAAVESINIRKKFISSRLKGFIHA